MTPALQPLKHFCVITYTGIRDGKTITGFINPKLGRFVCTESIQWATEDWCEAVTLAARYSYEASVCNEISVYQHFIVHGIMPDIKYVIFK